MNDFRLTFERIWRAISGEAAWQTVSDLSRYHRIQASPGYRQSAHLILQRLHDYGLQAEILSFPADEATQFWAWPSFQEWDCKEATLSLIEPHEEAAVLADYRASPISVIQRSTAFHGEADVVLLEDGEEEAEYEGLDLAGKVVLTRGDWHRVWELAVQERGAVGILSDGMRSLAPVRPEGDLLDVRQYTSFWWRPGDKKCFGFVLTPRQGQELRRLLKTPGETVRVRAHVNAHLYDGALEVVSATIPGRTEDEIVVVAHLCHPLPSANDNASGAAAALEAARALQSLIDSGDLAQLRRTLRFLWVPEMTGTFAYLADREARLERLVAGINLDMVGEDQCQTGSAWLFERPPDAAASFAPDLLGWLRDQLPALKGMTGVASSLSAMGANPLYRQAEVGYSGGSDHYILSDPTVGVPTPMLIQWPDRFYHTSADTPDRTDPQSLARAAAVASAYAYWLASAGLDDTTWLGYEMSARFRACLVERAGQAAAELWAQDGEEALARTLDGLDRRLAYLLGRHKAALGTLQRLADVECLLTDLEADAERAAERELAWVRRAAGLRAAALDLGDLAALPPRQLTLLEGEASGLVPVRKMRGPIPLSPHLGRLTGAERDAWRELNKARKDRSWNTLIDLAAYWADGSRSVLEIADVVELETGKRDVELLLAYFRLLEMLGFVSLGV
jgi:aminopeptidase YwaD